MIKAYKTELKLTKQQQQKALQSVGVCRFLYNSFIAYNQKQYASGGKYTTGMEYAKIVNHQIKEEKPWISDCGSKAWKQALLNADKAFKKFFKKQSGFPKFKKKGVSEPSLYFPNQNNDVRTERHRIRIPTFGWVRLKEFGYLPTKGVRSVTISCKYGRWFVSVLTNVTDADKTSIEKLSKGIGIDVGIERYLTHSNKKYFKNINKTKKIKHLTKRTKKVQRRIAKSQKGSSNRCKLRTRLQTLHRRITNIRVDYENKVINKLVKTKPAFVVVEDLDIKRMLKNRHLARSISEMRWYSFFKKLETKVTSYGGLFIKATRFYPSSKLCSCCGYKNDKLKLKDRVFICPNCGYAANRDLNAAFNLVNLGYRWLVGNRHLRANDCELLKTKVTSVK